MAEDVHRRGKNISEINEGDCLTVTESISKRDVMLYLGLTNDENPLYTKDIYVSEDSQSSKMVPPILLIGIITSTISRLFPGPGSEIVNIATNLILPVYHEQIVTFSFEVIKVDMMKEVITVSVEGTDENDNRVLDSVIMVRPSSIDKNKE